ncbi:hypothetical protein CEP77_05670 [Helicobacter pylori]|nr:hypothetical protein CEP77_05670 [Helicobacter pylori]
MAIVPNYLKLTLNYLYVFTITPTHTQRYILKFSLEQIKHLFFLKNAFNFYKKGFFCAFF